MSYIEKEKAIKADLASIENRVRHAFNQGYELGRKESKTADLSELIDKIEGTTWYHIANGKLVEGANSNDTPLYKASEILGIIQKFKFRGKEMTREEIEELKGLAASMGLYDDKNPCKRAVILGKAIKALEQEPTTKIEESNFSQEQYLADMQSAYDCGKSVIDKIRAEIFERIFEIIDEYKRKSEG